MSGGCNCGGALSTTTHEVTTDKGATRWAGQPVSGPVIVERQVCIACGRQRVEVYRDGKLIARRG